MCPDGSPRISRRAYLTISGMSVTGSLSAFAGCQQLPFDTSTSDPQTTPTPSQPETATPTSTLSQSETATTSSTTSQSDAISRPHTPIHVTGSDSTGGSYDIVVDDPKARIDDRESSEARIETHSGCDNKFSRIKGTAKPGQTDTFHVNGCIARVNVNGYVIIDRSYRPSDPGDAQFGKVVISGRGEYSFEMSGRVSVSDNSTESSDRVYSDQSGAEGVCKDTSDREDDYRADGAITSIELKSSTRTLEIDHDYASIPCSNPIV